MNTETKELLAKFAIVMVVIVVIVGVVFGISKAVNNKVADNLTTDEDTVTSNPPYNPGYYEKTMTYDAADEYENPLVTFGEKSSDATDAPNAEVPEQKQQEIFSAASDMRKIAAIRMNELVMEVLDPNADITDIRKWYGERGDFLPSDKIRKDIKNAKVTNGQEITFLYVIVDGEVRQVYNGGLQGTLEYKGVQYEFMVSGDFEIDEDGNMKGTFSPLYSVAYEGAWTPMQSVFGSE